MPSNHHVLCCPYLLLPSKFPSVRVFSNELALCIKLPKCHNFSLSISPSDEYSRLISFRIYSFDLAVQGVLKNFLQQDSSKASLLQCSTIFMVQVSHPYMTTGKNIDLTILTFVSSVTSLLFKTVSRFVIAFLPKNKHLLNPGLQLPSTVIL